MKKIAYVLIALIVAALFVSAVSAEEMIGGDRGFIRVNCDVEGATVSLININNAVYGTETIVNGQAEFIVGTTVTPVDRVYVTADGYIPGGASVDNPAPGKTEYVTVSLEPEYTGGDRGFVDIRSNIIGAKIVLKDISGNEAYVGYTDGNGFVEFIVYAMGTPLKTAELTAPGWNYQSMTITSPASGQTVSYTFPSQNPAPTTAVPTVPTQSPIGLAVFGLIGAIGAVALLRRE
ncbi:MAG: hypothetical protein Q4Q53_00795 [Methanocorpusculum sp.]|nr:hypothetical protein [Methanocorpusculum sp.]